MARALTLNLAAVLALCVFWVAGVQGFGSGALDLPALAVAIALMAGAAWAACDERAELRLSIAHLGPRDAAFLAVFAGGMLAFSWPRLSQDLWSDGLYHASLATRHAQLALFHVQAHMPDLWRTIATMDARSFIWAFNAGALVVAALIFLAAPLLLLLRRAPPVLAILWIAALVAVRYATSAEHGVFAHDATPVLIGMHPEQDPHPPLRLLPLWISAALFGPQALAFRLAGFAALLAATGLLYVLLRRSAPVLTAALAALAIATVPALWHTAYLVEASIWPTLVGAGLFALLIMPDGGRMSLVAPAAAVACAAWMRAPAFILLVPLAGLAAARLAETRAPRFEGAAVVLCMALALAGATSAVLGGSPAVGATPPLAQLLSALANNIPYVAIVATTGLAPLLFVSHALRTDTTRGAIAATTLVAFLLIALAVFYGPTTPLVWGTSRYQAEIAGPLIAAGLCAFAFSAPSLGALVQRGRSLLGDGPLARALPAAPLTLVVVFNLFGMATLDANRQRYFPHAIPGQNIKSEAEYAIGYAFDIARTRNALAHTYYVGIWYGGFQGVLQGMTGADYVAFSNLNARHRAGWAVDAGAMIADPDVTMVIVENDAPFDVIGPLVAAGWTRSVITHPASGLALTVFLRP